VPGLGNQAFRIDRDYRRALRLILERDLTDDFRVRPEHAAIQHRKKSRGIGLAGLRAAAQTLNDVTAIGLIGDTETGRHQCGRDGLQVGNAAGTELEPTILLVLELQVLRNDLGDPVHLRSRGPVTVKQDIGDGGDETDGSQPRDAQRQAELEVDCARHPHVQAPARR
jgi:hypothetical protein